MLKSGLIIGAVSFIIVLGFAVVVTPLCVPCIGIFLGLAAGYFAGVFDKPGNSNDSIKKGAGAGAIAGAIGFLGGLVGAVINGVLVNPANSEALLRNFGISGLTINQAQIWASQFGAAFCLGLFDILWMAILGLAGGALWYQISGKYPSTTTLPPQEPLPPSI